MKGGFGFISTRTVRDLLNPKNDNPYSVTDDPRKLIGALIIKAYNELKQEENFRKLPDIPNNSRTFIPESEEDKSIKTLVNYYRFIMNLPDQSSSTDNVQISKNFPNSKKLSRDEFSKWLRYILEGKVYKKKLPYYTDDEFDRFTSLALSLDLFLFKLKNNNTSKTTKVPPTPPPQPPEYEKYVVSDNVKSVSDLCPQLVTNQNSILFSMCCVISLNRKDKQWKWVKLSDSEQLSPNPYCAKRKYKRLMRMFSNPLNYEPLDKINVSMLDYNISELNISELVEEFHIKTINEIIKAMLLKVIIADIKKQFEETSQFSFIHIVSIKDKYKYYEIKIFRSNIWNPNGGRTQPIPAIMMTLSAFDEDGICDFEFVYVCVIPPSKENPQQSGADYNDETFKAKVKEETYHKLTAEMTRLKYLLGGQTFSAPTTSAGTLKQYYDMIDLQFEASRTNSEVPLMDSKPVVLNKDEHSEDPCTLILEYEQNEKGQEEPVWKVAQATDIQIAAFKRVEEYLLTRLQSPKILDNTSIRVFKISNRDTDKNRNITVLVEVKKQDKNGKLLYVYYQALGGERYEVYPNSSVAGEYAQSHKDKYNWVTSTGP
jgi:hypothetical protein